MARLNGLFDSFSGSIGNYVGCRWKGDIYIRSKPIRRRTHQPSPKQLAQRRKFSLARGFCNQIAPLLKFSFEPDAKQTAGKNQAVSWILRNAIKETETGFSLEYPGIRISQGHLPSVEDIVVEAAGSGHLRFLWSDKDSKGVASRRDRALLVVHCPELDQSLYSTTTAVRHMEVATLNVSSFRGKTVHTWLGFISEDNQRIATSAYTGEWMVL